MDSTMMFACTVCNTVEMYTMVSNQDNKCSVCENGQWHGFFEQETFDPNKHVVNNRSSGSDPMSDEVDSFS